MKRTKLLLLSLLFGLILLTPHLIFAQKINDPGASTPKIVNPLANPKLSVSIPGLQFRDATCTNSECTVPWLADYIQGLYRYGISIIGIIAIIGIMLGGVIWLTAGGNDEKIADGKKWISGSILGTLIAITSYMILNLVNPALTVLSPLKLAYIKHEPLDTNAPIVGSFPSKTTSSLPLPASLVYDKMSYPSEVYSKSWLDSLIPVAYANKDCVKVLSSDSDIPGGQVRNDWMLDNAVPKINCPHSGGPDAVRAIAEEIASKSMVTYRFGGKGNPPPYTDGARGNATHSCNQDPECVDQIRAKHAENDPNNCKYCCPAGQACIDCSGFVDHVANCAGIPFLNMGTGGMNGCAGSPGVYKITSIDKQNNTVNGEPLIPGDILVLDGHVVIYIGNGETAESSPYGNDDAGRRPGAAVRIRPLTVGRGNLEFLTIVKANDGLPQSHSIACIGSWDWDCKKAKDCCAQGAFCRYADNNRKRCEVLNNRCIPLDAWDCEKPSDCCAGTCKFGELSNNPRRGVCRTQ